MVELYNIQYKYDGMTKEYLAIDTDYETAQKHYRLFVRQYVGRPYPNGKGFYPISNVRIVRKL